MARKSSIDTLPPEVLTRLNQMIGEGLLSLDDLKAWLDGHGHDRSRSALGRHAKKIRSVAAKLKQSREIADSLTREIGEDLTSSKQGRILVEILRTMVFDFATKKMDDDGDEETGAGEFFFLAKAVKELAQANRLDQDYEAKVRERIGKEAEDKARKALKDKGVKKADSEAVLAAIRAVYTG